MHNIPYSRQRNVSIAIYIALFLNPVAMNAICLNRSLLFATNIRESVDSLCRDGADAQYMQYLRKSRITSPQIR